MTSDSPEPVLGRPAEPSTQIDTFALQGAVDEVVFTSNELTAVCPMTDQPDFYEVVIRYQPKERCIETKSLKLYLRTFDGQGIFAEHLAPAIASHLAEAVQTTVTVELRQQVRGGIVTDVTATAG